MEVLKEAEKFLENQIEANKHVEEIVRQLEKKLVVIKDERLRLSQTINTYTTEVGVIRLNLLNF